MGVLAHRLRTLDRSLVPHGHEQKLYCLHICKVTFKNLPQPLRSYTYNFNPLAKLKVGLSYDNYHPNYRLNQISYI